MIRRLYDILFIFFIIAGSLSSFAQCITEAGEDKYICKNSGVGDTVLNADVVSGTSPYTYGWDARYDTGYEILTASDFLDDTTLLRPTVVSSDLGNKESVRFYLTVNDNAGNTCTDSMQVTFSEFGYLLGECREYIYSGDSVELHHLIFGGIAPYRYAWSPDYNITDTTVANPEVWPETDTTYSLTLTDSVGCITGSSCKIFVNTVPIHPPRAAEEIRIFPNPVSDASVLKIFKGYNVREVRLYDDEGQLIWKEANPNGNIPIGKTIRKAGTYFLKIIDNKGAVTSKKLIRL